MVGTISMKYKLKFYWKRFGEGGLSKYWTWIELVFYGRWDTVGTFNLSNRSTRWWAKFIATCKRIQLTIWVLSGISSKKFYICHIDEIFNINLVKFVLFGFKYA